VDELNVGPLPVWDGPRLMGMLTDRDITVRSAAVGLDSKSTKVRDVLTTDVVYGLDDEDVRDAANVMEEKQIRRQAVLDHDHHLVGILSLGDLAVEMHHDRLSCEALERVSKPAAPDR
jgi:CBS domain-containing protein